MKLKWESVYDEEHKLSWYGAHVTQDLRVQVYQAANKGWYYVIYLRGCDCQRSSCAVGPLDNKLLAETAADKRLTEMLGAFNALA